MSALEKFHRFRQTDAWIYATMLLSACISLTASLVLSVDAIELAKNPAAALSCNISSVLNCGKVGVTWQANLLGFPNAFLGLMAEPVVITIAVAGLTGVRFKRGFMLAAQLVYTIGVVFAYWLFAQAYFVIGALCPWCLLVTLSTTLVFATLTHLNIRDSNLFLPPRVQAALESGLRMGLDLLIVMIVLIALVAMVAVKYGAYLFG